MKEILSKMLVCPGCHFPLKLATGKQAYYCSKCQKIFPVEKGIPRFVSEDKYIGKPRETMVNFGYEWKKWERLPSFAENGFFDLVKLKPRFFKGKKVLDAGCGNGRYMAGVMPAIGEKGLLVGVDLSVAVEPAQKKIKKGKNVHLLQADLYHLPFKENCFDVVYCVGVLQHLPDKRKAISLLAKLLRPNGCFIGTFYGKPDNFLIFAYISLIMILRKFLVHLPLSWTLLVSRVLAFLSSIIYIQPLSFIRKRLSYFQDMYTRFPEYQNYKPPLDYLTHIWFDQLSAPITGFFTKKEVASWFKGSELEPIFSEWFGLVYASKKASVLLNQYMIKK